MGFFTPAWQGKNEEKALKAVAKIADRTKLTAVVYKAPLEVVRYAAIKKIASMPNTFGVAKELLKNAITTQSFLKMVALRDEDRMFRQYAVARLKDQGLMAHIAKNDSNKHVRSTAVKKLADQGVLGDIAQNDPEWYVRLEAVKKLENQRLLSVIAKKDEESGVRTAAVNKINDQCILADISLCDKDWGVRNAAIKRVTDQNDIGRYLVNEPKHEDYYRWAAGCGMYKLLKKIDTQSILAYVAENTSDKYLASDAAKRVVDESMLIRIAKNGGFGAQQEAIRRIKDGAVLAEFAMNAGNQELRKNAICRVSDLALLCNIAKNDEDRDIRISALHRLRSVCFHEWICDKPCHKRCAVCGIYEYDHDYVEISAVDYGGASHTIKYKCRKCGHEAEYSQSEIRSCDTREIGLILE